MAKIDYTQFAREIVAAVGGKENIISVGNCMTRLRFVLKDDSIPDKEKVASIKGVKGVMNQGGQYQVIIGTNVSDLIDYVKKEADLTDSKAADKDSYKVVKEGSLWNRFFKTIAGCIMPMIGPLVASGIIKGLLVILTTAGVLKATDGTYILLYAAADAVMYFMPILVGFTCGKIFNCNPYVTAVIGGAFLYPNLLTAVSAKGGMTFLTLHVTSVSYANTFLPILLAAFFASKLEKLAKKIIPSVLQLIFVPTFVVIITVPVAWLALGPVMNILSSLLSKAVMGIFGVSPLIGGMVIGACWQLVVLLGLHTAFIPILMNNLFSLGYDPVNAIMGLSVWAFAGVALGYALKNKDQEKKSMGLGNMVSVLCGVTEPTIYSIALTNIRLFAAGMIGGGVAGGILGALGGKMYVYAGDGIFRIPAMINPKGIDISFYGFIICAVVAFVIAAVVSFIFTTNSKDEAEKIEITEKTIDKKETRQKIYAPVKGTAIPQDQIKDETFASGMLGKGVGIRPSESVVYAPFDGVISSVTETKHAVGMVSDQDVQLLIHIGIDTVKMNGEGFKVFVKDGQAVKKGDKLIEFDREKIKAANFDDIVVTLVINSDEYQKVECHNGACEENDVIINVE